METQLIRANQVQKKAFVLLKSILGEFEDVSIELVDLNQEKKIEIKKTGNGWRLSCSTLTSFCRGIGLIYQFKEKKIGFSYQEALQVDSLGVMIDCSRNAIPHIQGLKKMLTHLALMGYNIVQLYTEDTYEIEGMPFFGYMRGAYTQEELQTVDCYASDLGIEIVPCIQTLAHLKHILKWEAFEDYIDCDDILLSGEEQTYGLIDKMFQTMSSAFASRQINIGMDEAHMLGLGRYLDKHGYENRVTIIMKHLERVLMVAKKYNYEVMMWSDMFFRLLNKGEYYVHGQPIDRSILEMIPEGIKLIYWDYYTKDYDVYDKMFQRHKEIGRKIIFAGGAWKWAGFAPMNRESIQIGDTAASAVLKNNIKDILITCWGDNGAEASMFSVLPTLMYWAELYWSQRKDETWIEQRFEVCANASFKDFLVMDDLNKLTDNPEFVGLGANPSKYLFYQDPLLGIADFLKFTEDLKVEYYQTSVRLLAIINRSSEWRDLYEVQYRLSKFMEKKSDLGYRIRKAYKNHNQIELEQITVKDIPEAIERLESFQRFYRKQWKLENKAYGLEIFDIRTGALKERLKQAQHRIENYTNGQIHRIEELEGQVLAIRKEKVKGTFMSGIHWEEVVSPSTIYGV